MDDEPAPDEIVIYIPAVDDDQIANGLRDLTRRIVEGGHSEWTGGALGGEWGYGADFDNDVFRLHPFCWCGQPDCQWCVECSCPDDAVTYLVNGRDVAFDEWLNARDSNRDQVTHSDKQCAYCRGELVPAPHFLHKPSGSTISWYKYIGRDMEVNLTVPWAGIIRDCIESL